jgi:hypothetical protein
MFVPNLGERICARCFLPISKDANCTFILETDHGDASFCYECGILEQHHCYGTSLEELDKKWRAYFEMDDIKPQPNKQS